MFSIFFIASQFLRPRVKSDLTFCFFVIFVHWLWAKYICLTDNQLFLPVNVVLKIWELRCIEVWLNLYSNLHYERIKDIKNQESVFLYKTQQSIYINIEDPYKHSHRLREMESTASKLILWMLIFNKIFLKVAI